MGYVHDVNMAIWVAPTKFMHSQGTWTTKETATADVWCVERTANNNTYNSFIPIRPPQNSNALKGSKLVSVDIGYIVTAAGGALDSLIPVIYKVTKQIDGAALVAGSATLLAFGYDLGHDTAGERAAAGNHWMTLTLTTPLWMDDDDLYFVEVASDGSAGSVHEFLGARINFTLRM